MLALLLIGAGLMCLSGLVCPLVPGSGRGRDALFAAIMGLGGLLGAVAAVGALARDGATELTAAWPLPWGRVWLHLDAMSAAFVLPVFVVPALGAVYGSAYWREGRAVSGTRLRVFYGLLAGSMAVVTVARDGVLFLIAWEVMAISAFFAIAAEDGKPEVRRAAWVYFVATHLGSLALIAMFALLHAGIGRFDLAPLASGELSPALSRGVFVLALVGFGLKAGIMPLHVWLPGAHANAPSHVSAVLSGVMLKMGVYGLVRVTGLLPEVEAWWGWLLVSLGAVSAVVGIAFGTAQHDYKRLLAYSSIENIGVIVLALGVALVGRASGDPALSAAGLAGGVLHAWNHALFKPLLFLVAGNVLHATGTRRMNLLGGLARAMPWTARAACLGCVAIAALPPLNGFVSEWLIYRGLLRGVSGGAAGASAGFAGAGAALALTGGLVVVAFVRLYATLFLGTARSPAPEGAHEAPAAMLAPMIVLGALCAGVGVAPFLVAGALAPVVGIGAGPESEEALRSGLLDPLRPIGAVAAGLILAVGALVPVVRRLARAPAAPRAGTWGCGYVRPSARMQYGESGLGQMVAALFAWVLVPRRRGGRIEGPFPGAASQRTEAPDLVLERAVRPGLGGLARLIMRLRLLQQGKIQIYMLYVLLIVIVLLAWEGR